MHIPHNRMHIIFHLAIGHGKKGICAVSESAPDPNATSVSILGESGAKD